MKIDFFLFERGFNILRIIIQVDKCTKMAGKICHGLKRFDLILILNHLGK
jgi:hypothetical protein